jgi:hypothetical protein
VRGVIDEAELMSRMAAVRARLESCTWSLMAGATAEYFQGMDDAAISWD